VNQWRLAKKEIFSGGFEKQRPLITLLAGAFTLSV
jgi:hypothetical protein